jgi:hypothetical protein
MGKVVGLDGRPIGGGPKEPEDDDEKRVQRIYEIKVTGGDTFNAQGFLVATPVFIAVADDSGDFIVVVPFTALVSVTFVSDADATQSV